MSSVVEIVTCVGPVLRLVLVFNLKAQKSTFIKVIVIVLTNFGIVLTLTFVKINCRLCYLTICARALLRNFLQDLTWLKTLTSYLMNRNVAINLNWCWPVDWIFSSTSVPPLWQGRDFRAHNVISLMELFFNAVIAFNASRQSGPINGKEVQTYFCCKI
jgi:hypothetical protein